MEDKKLADALEVDLAKNYFDASFRGKLRHYEGHRNEYVNSLFEVFGHGGRMLWKQLRESPYVRNIIVVGAGASHASYKPLPCSGQAKQDIKEALGARIYEQRGYLSRLEGQEVRLRDRKQIRENEGNFEDSKVIEEALDLVHITSTHYQYHFEKFNQEKRHIEALFPSGANLDFESTLALLSEFYSVKDLRSTIQRIFGRQYYPSITYEIIAHMLKHRFVDAVINFNFDELLDQAIDEELGSTEYRKILSDGDCGDFSDMIISGRLKLPLYLKPHGTASHKSTLRFTKADYVGIPRDIENVMLQLLQGNAEETSKRGGVKVQRINLICIGFGMESVEFNNILTEVTKNSRLQYFGYFYNISRKAEDIFRSKTKANSRKNVDSITIGEDNKNLEGKIEGLWNGVVAKFNKEYSPRGIERNLVVCHLFHRFRLKDLESENNTDRGTVKDAKVWLYPLLRTIVEIILAVFLNKGKINVVQLINGRVGLYYNLYYEYFKQWKNEKESRRKHFPISIYEIVQCLGLVRNDLFDREYFRINKSLGQKLTCKEIISYLGTFLPNVRSLIQTENGRLGTEIPYYYDELISRIEKLQGIKNYLLRIYERSPYDVKSRFSEYWYHLFDQHYADDILHTRLSWKLAFQDLIKKRNWDHALLSSERGRTLEYNRSELTHGNRTFTLILSENTYGYAGGFLKGKVNFISNSDLGHHISIFFKRLSENTYIKISDLSFDLTQSLTKGAWFPSVLDSKFRPVSEEINELDSTQEYYIVAGNLIPREAVYFKLNREVNEANPILVTSQFSKEMEKKGRSVAEGVQAKERVWDSDLLFLTKKFFLYLNRTDKENRRGAQTIKREEFHGDHKFLEWLHNGLGNLKTKD